MASCLDDEQALAYLGGGLSPAQVDALDAHLGGCPDCCALLARLARIVDESSGTNRHAEPAPPAVRSGQTLGRYRLGDELGRGVRSHDRSVVPSTSSIARKRWPSSPSS